MEGISHIVRSYNDIIVTQQDAYKKENDSWIEERSKCPSLHKEDDHKFYTSLGLGHTGAHIDLALRRSIVNSKAQISKAYCEVFDTLMVTLEDYIKRTNNAMDASFNGGPIDVKAFCRDYVTHLRNTSDTISHAQAGFISVVENTPINHSSIHDLGLDNSLKQTYETVLGIIGQETRVWLNCLKLKVRYIFIYILKRINTQNERLLDEIMSLPDNMDISHGVKRELEDDPTPAKRRKLTT